MQDGLATEAARLAGAAADFQEQLSRPAPSQSGLSGDVGGEPELIQDPASAAPSPTLVAQDVYVEQEVGPCLRLQCQQCTAVQSHRVHHAVWWQSV